MGSPRLAYLLGLISFAAVADRPSAVQLCFRLPEGVALFAATEGPNYRSIAPGVNVLDLDLKLNGVAPDRLTRNGDACVRAWLPAMNVHTVSVSFERTTLSLAAQEKKVDLKLKPDLWYDAGSLDVARDPWATMSTELPGLLTLERVSSAGSVGVKDLQHVPSGTYRVAYVAPPLPTGPCRTTLRATGVGTVRADNKPAHFAELVELYRTEWLPEVAKDQKLVCTRSEAIEVDLRIVDGTYRNALRPEMKRVRVAEMEPKYVLRIGATRMDFQSGASFEFGAGQEVVLSETVGTVAAVP